MAKIQNNKTGQGGREELLAQLQSNKDWPGGRIGIIGTDSEQQNRLASGQGGKREIIGTNTEQ